MTPEQVLSLRRAHQHLLRPQLSDPAAIVRHFGAVQAQDYLGALWALGQRARGCTMAEVEAAFERREIVRTWPMRGTLHFVAAEDVRWMLALLAARVARRNAGRLAREFAIDEAVLARARRCLVQALRSGNSLPRTRVYDLLESHGIVTDGHRGNHIIGHLAQEGLICSGPRSGNQQAFVLLDAWLPPAPVPTREEALARLGVRYLGSHGPATEADFAWWSGLNLSEVRETFALLGGSIASVRIQDVTYWFIDPPPSPRRAPTAHLLPPFDEYLVGYRDRALALAPRFISRLKGLLAPAIELNGRVVGTWGRKREKECVWIRMQPFGRLTADQELALNRVAKRYGRFLGSRVQLE